MGCQALNGKDRSDSLHMKKAQPAPTPQPPPSLTVPTPKAREMLQVQIDKGEGMLSRRPTSQEDLDRLEEEKRLWSDYNATLLKKIFTTSEMADEYTAFYGGGFSTQPNFGQLLRDFYDDLRDSLTRLRSIHGRLDLFDAPGGSDKHTAITGVPSGAVTSKETSLNSNAQAGDIFLVHGQNDQAKETVARYLEKLGLKVVVLHEQPNLGRTIIEKFQDYASVRYAVVLLTADDVGASTKSASDLKPRARQNVILELGFFMGKLGRHRTCAMLEAGVEIPSDYSGIVYISLDASGAWRLLLGKELRAAGLDVDLNRAAV